MKTAGGHLTYCTNIHPGESWEAVFENVRTHVLAVKAKLGISDLFGVGLRLSAEAARRLRQPGELERFRDFLAANGLYVFTINGFPYGPFHGQSVKAAVYRPDWTDAERGRYTADLAELLAALLPDGVDGSISTVPGGFKRDVQTSAQVEQITRSLIERVLELHAVRERTGKTITLALEPEPCCFLETTSETLHFFEHQLLSPASRERLAAGAGVPVSRAEPILRRHLGVCLDTCHAAIEFEDADDALDRLLGAGLRIAKLQLSAGLRLPGPSADLLQALRAYDEPVYLHQVVARTPSGELLRFEDLPLALGSPEARAADEWRVHFHVPLYRERLGAFSNTQAFLARILERQSRAPVTRELEVETYTWDVLPPEQRTGNVDASIARELSWVLERLQP
ncbi:MAG TPA: metabolite traffic protein EboE [Polyangiaceae bacterium]|nr:metabolite traffic protein EboE [Polyangiaceae bacterium]